MNLQILRWHMVVEKEREREGERERGKKRKEKKERKKDRKKERKRVDTLPPRPFHCTNARPWFWQSGSGRTNHLSSQHPLTSTQRWPVPSDHARLSRRVSTRSRSEAAKSPSLPVMNARSADSDICRRVWSRSRSPQDPRIPGPISSSIISTISAAGTAAIRTERRMCGRNTARSSEVSSRRHADKHQSRMILQCNPIS